MNNRRKKLNSSNNFLSKKSTNITNNIREVKIFKDSLSHDGIYEVKSNYLTKVIKLVLDLQKNSVPIIIDKSVFALIMPRNKQIDILFSSLGFTRTNWKLIGLRWAWSLLFTIASLVFISRFNIF